MTYEEPDACPTDIGLLHARLYGGAIILFRQLPAMVGLVAHVRSMLEAEFDTPTLVHESLSDAEQVTRFSAIQRGFSRAPEVKARWAGVFSDIGYDLTKTVRDRLFLRFQPHQGPGQTYARARSTATLPFHRDSWGSNLYAQVNWWAPIYPITAGRTLEIYPQLWDRPVRNSSHRFDLADVLARSRSQGITTDDANPVAEEDLTGLEADPVLIEPGDLIAFSAAHAHAGVPNSTGRTRISTETRTLWLPDLDAGNGAPNVDGAAPWASPGWFRRISDGALLPDILGCNELVPYAPPKAAILGAGGT